MHDKVKSVEEKSLKKDIPDFSPGDTVAVHLMVREGDRERTQVFEGIVIKRKGGGIRETFTVRKVSFGIGVERTFLLHSPLIKGIKVLKKERARRANLSYIKDKRYKK